MMRLRRLHMFAALGVVTAFVACTLNPQPLPPIVDPEEDNAAGPGGGFVTIDSGSRQDDEAPADSDAGNGDASSPPLDSDGGDAGSDDAGDAGDAGDVGDAEVD